LLAAAGFVGWQQYRQGALTLPFLPPSEAAQARMDWEAVDRSDAAALREYLAAQPADQPYRAEAEANLVVLEQSLFDAAMRAIDAAPIEAFLTSFPESARAAEARMRLDRVRGEAPGALIPLPQQVRDAADPLESPEQQAPEATAAPGPTTAPAPTPAAPPAPEVRGAPL
jgi:hypothetical protein